MSGSKQLKPASECPTAQPGSKPPLSLVHLRRAALPAAAAAAAEEGGGGEEEDGYRWDSFFFLSLIDLILRILVKKKKLIALDGAPSL